jgi:hypothetical protein
VYTFGHQKAGPACSNPIIYNFGRGYFFRTIISFSGKILYVIILEIKINILSYKQLVHIKLDNSRIKRVTQGQDHLFQIPPCGYPT